MCFRNLSIYNMERVGYLHGILESGEEGKDKSGWQHLKTITHNIMAWLICKILIFQKFLSTFIFASSLSKWSVETRSGWRLMRRNSVKLFELERTRIELLARKLDEKTFSRKSKIRKATSRMKWVGERVLEKCIWSKRISTIIIDLDRDLDSESTRCYCEHYLVAIWTSPSFLISSQLQKSPTIRQKLV